MAPAPQYLSTPPVSSMTAAYTSISATHPHLTFGGGQWHSLVRVCCMPSGFYSTRTTRMGCTPAGTTPTPLLRWPYLLAPYQALYCLLVGIHGSVRRLW
ncbi:hypothetical protein BD779DRAFT_470086 [Infundibulicybe gibba]|nr:hypothetical protein BD779DRAFT_470086 [Infundibulicybe gibba]